MPDPIPLHRGPRLVHPAPPELKREVADLDLWLNRQHNAPSLVDDLRALWAGIRAEPGSHLLAALLGLAAGAFGTVGLALIYGAFFL